MLRLLPWEYAVRNLGRAPTRLALTVGGSALVVLLVLAAAAFVRGMKRSLQVSGNPRNVVLLGAGSEESVERSEILAGADGIVAASVRGIKTRLGVPYVSPEVHMASLLKTAPGEEGGYMAMLRGVRPAAFLVHDQVRVVEGRLPGPDELLVGRLAGARMGLDDARLAVGQKLWLDHRAWTISGRFEAPGTVMEAEIWCDLRELQIAAKRDNLSCVVLTLDTAEFADVDVFSKQRLDLELVALHETDYYAKLTEFYRPVQVVVWISALLIALGGFFGGLNTMYAAFAARVREMGSLQTLGYSRRAIVTSMVQESTLATLAGALLAAAAGLVFLDGLAVRFSMGAFGLVLDAPVLALGLLAGLVLGIVGALPPAWHCLRPAIPEALKAA
ncbi:MAG: ABC transporter permease [Planctomycetota bacterium]|nr:ABC transporter permease [Planctomycetota bacterium]